MEEVDLNGSRQKTDGQREGAEQIIVCKDRAVLMKMVLKMNLVAKIMNSAFT